MKMYKLCDPSNTSILLALCTSPVLELKESFTTYGIVVHLPYYMLPSSFVS